MDTANEERMQVACVAGVIKGKCSRIQRVPIVGQRHRARWAGHLIDLLTHWRRRAGRIGGTASIRDVHTNKGGSAILHGGGVPAGSLAGLRVKRRDNDERLAG